MLFTSCSNFGSWSLQATLSGNIYIYLYIKMLFPPQNLLKCFLFVCHEWSTNFNIINENIIFGFLNLCSTQLFPFFTYFHAQPYCWNSSLQFWFAPAWFLPRFSPLPSMWQWRDFLISSPWLRWQVLRL